MKRTLGTKLLLEDPVLLLPLLNLSWHAMTSNVLFETINSVNQANATSQDYSDEIFWRPIFVATVLNYIP